MKLKKGMKIRFVGFAWRPDMNNAGMCGDPCKVVESSKEQELNWPTEMWLVESRPGKNRYWIHACQAKAAEGARK